MIDKIYGGTFSQIKVSLNHNLKGDLAIPIMSQRGLVEPPRAVALSRIVRF